jgi:hypothetical protein
VLALFCGNLETFLEYLVSRGLLSPEAGRTLAINHFADGVVPGVWPPTNSFWWFHASRIIPNLQPDGIDEFPFFSAFLSDLHPHFVAIPFELLVLAVAAAHVVSRGATLRSAWTQGLGAIALGGLLVINTWDIAPFWLLYIGLGLYAARMSGWRWGWAAAALTPFAGAALYLPYFVGYSGPPLGLGIVRERTPFGSLLVLFGWAAARAWWRGWRSACWANRALVCWSRCSPCCCPGQACSTGSIRPRRRQSASARSPPPCCSASKWSSSTTRSTHA